MPRLNLRDDGLDSDSAPLDTEKVTPAPPTLRDVGGGGGGRVSPIFLVGLIVLVLGGSVFLLNQFKVIHLWGKKVPKVAESIEQTAPDPNAQGDQGGQAEGGNEAGAGTEQATGGDQSSGSEATPELSSPDVKSPEVKSPDVKSPAVKSPEVKTPPAAGAAKTPARSEKPVLNVPAGTGGSYTVQVSSWPNQAQADEEAGRLAKVGLDAYVQPGAVGGTRWFRVRIGHYGTEKEAAEAAGQMQKSLEGTVWIARAGK